MGNNKARDFGVMPDFMNRHMVGPRRKRVKDGVNEAIANGGPAQGSYGGDETPSNPDQIRNNRLVCNFQRSA